MFHRIFPLFFFVYSFCIFLLLFLLQFRTNSLNFYGNDETMAKAEKKGKETKKNNIRKENLLHEFLEF